MNRLRLTTRRTLASIIFAFTLRIATSLAQDAASAPEVTDLIPADGIMLDVMELRGTPRFVELSKKMQQAVAKDRDWWLNHVSNSKPGEALPYDARMGVTKQEYGEYLSLASKLTLAKTTTIKVKVKREPDRITLTFGEGLPGLEEVVLDTKADTVTTPYGIAATRNLIKASNEQKATGPWDGIQWKLDKSEADSGISTRVKFALGKLKESGRGIIYYDAKEIGEKAKSVVSYTLQYDLKPAR